MARVVSINSQKWVLSKRVKQRDGTYAITEGDITPYLVERFPERFSQKGASSQEALLTPDTIIFSGFSGGMGVQSIHAHQEQVYDSLWDSEGEKI